jgi:hypothetical protein
MNNNILNIGLKALVAIIAIVGIYLTVTLVQGGNPASYDNKDIVKLGTEVALEQNKKDELSQAELEKFIMDEGIRVKEEREAAVQSNVNTILNFTFYVLGAVIVVLILGSALSIAGDFKKSLVGIISTVGFLILVYIIYSVTSDVVPAEYLAAEAKELANNPEFEAVYTPSNWKMVSAAFTTTMILGGVAIFMWIAGSVMKIVK